jgi:hypothetical protein
MSNYKNLRYLLLSKLKIKLGTNVYGLIKTIKGSSKDHEVISVLFYLLCSHDITYKWKHSTIQSSKDHEVISVLSDRPTNHD